MPAIREKTRKRLQDISPPFIRMRNPVDIYGAVNLSSYEHAYGAAMEAVLEDLSQFERDVPAMSHDYCADLDPNCHFDHH